MSRSLFYPHAPYNALAPLSPLAPSGVPEPLRIDGLIGAHRALGELKGICYGLPDPTILLDLVALREGQASSAIENYVTTQDELYRALDMPRR